MVNDKFLYHRTNHLTSSIIFDLVIDLCNETVPNHRKFHLSSKGSFSHSLKEFSYLHSISLCIGISFRILFTNVINSNIDDSTHGLMSIDIDPILNHTTIDHLETGAINIITNQIRNPI